MTHFKHLEHLEVCSGSITDVGVVHYISAMKSLMSLNIAQNRGITDASMERLSTLHNLTSLNLTHTSITNSGLSRLNKLDKLQSLAVYNTKLTKAAVLQLTNALPALQSIGV